jgi:hypothetical protein
MARTVLEFLLFRRFAPVHGGDHFFLLQLLAQVLK